MAQTRPREIFGPYGDDERVGTAGHTLIHGVCEFRDAKKRVRGQKEQLKKKTCACSAKERPRMRFEEITNDWVVRLRRERGSEPRKHENNGGEDAVNPKRG